MQSDNIIITINRLRGQGERVSVDKNVFIIVSTTISVNRKSELSKISGNFRENDPDIGNTGTETEKYRLRNRKSYVSKSGLKPKS